MMTILYKVYNNLYVNLTNRCTCNCTFCLRQTRDEMNHSGSLWLDREPTVEEIKAAFLEKDMSEYEEVVFCGFGEPTMRLEDLLVLATWVKETYHMPTRVNTNGLANLYYKRNNNQFVKSFLFLDWLQIIRFSWYRYRQCIKLLYLSYSNVYSCKKKI